MGRSALVISLDFELNWGVRDVTTLDAYRDNLLGVRETIPATLSLFSRYGVHATWATVGMLFCRTKREIEEALPSRLPHYEDPSLSPYDLSRIGDDEKSDPFHYAPTLVEAIARTPGQEIGTHTFSHFYCLERGQTAEDFDADLASAQKVAARFGIEPKSIVYPRNQDNCRYHHVLARRGIKVFRSNGGRWPYTPATTVEPKVKRAFRLADAYLPLAGARTFPFPRADANGLFDVQASAFLRPYHHGLRRCEGLKLRRIASAMSRAAEMGEIFHLWWHPHNFGREPRENLANLARVLEHFAVLRRRHGMESLSMIEAAGDAA